MSERKDVYPGYYPVGIDDNGALKRRIESILDDNPGMNRYDAFLLAWDEQIRATEQVVEDDIVFATQPMRIE